MKSTRTGGSMLNFEDFPPELLEEMKRIFEEECAKRGTPVHMEMVFSE